MPVSLLAPRRVGNAASIVVGAVFAAAAVSKLVSPSEFSDALHKASLVPHEWVRGLALGVPVAELTISWFLIVGYARRAALSASALLLGAFTAYLVALVWMYTVPPDCGCISQFEAFLGQGRPAAVFALARNTVLIALVGVAWYGMERDSAFGNVQQPCP